MKLKKLIEERRGDILRICRLHGARSVRLFGSYARRASTEASDVDLLVELNEPTFDHYMELKFRLEELFGRDVDLVLKDALKPRIRPIIEKQVRYV